MAVNDAVVVDSEDAKLLTQVRAEAGVTVSECYADALADPVLEAVQTQKYKLVIYGFMGTQWATTMHERPEVNDFVNQRSINATLLQQLSHLVYGPATPTSEVAPVMAQSASNPALVALANQVSSRSSHSDVLHTHSHGHGHSSMRMSGMRPSVAESHLSHASNSGNNGHTSMAVLGELGEVLMSVEHSASLIAVRKLKLAAPLLKL